MSVKNFFVVSSVPTPANPARPKPPAPKCVTMLEAMPGFWRGRAFTRREMAKLFRQAGDLEAGNRHDREAKKYEAIANSGAVIALRQSVTRVGAYGVKMARLGGASGADHSRPARFGILPTSSS